MNQSIDLNADIIPSVSCGNIMIRSNLSDCDFLTSALWLEHINPNVDLRESQGWVCRRLLSKENKNIFETVCYFRNDVVMLCFNSDNILYFILVKNGYQGKVFADIGIDSTLGDLKRHIKIEYDSGDEAYYPCESSGITGVAFYTGLSPSAMPDDEELFLLDGGDIDSLDNDQEIVMISIQDWSLMSITGEIYIS